MCIYSKLSIREKMSSSFLVLFSEISEFECILGIHALVHCLLRLLLSFAITNVAFLSRVAGPLDYSNALTKLRLWLAGTGPQGPATGFSSALKSPKCRSLVDTAPKGRGHSWLEQRFVRKVACRLSTPARKGRRPLKHSTSSQTLAESSTKIL